MAAGDLHRDLRGGIRAVIACGMNAAGVPQPVALGQHPDHLRPARVRLVGAVRRDVPLVRAQRSAGRLLALVFAPPRAQRRARSSSERSSFGNVGVPVLPAIQSIPLQVFASKTCSQARRDVPARWPYESPLRITSAASRASGSARRGEAETAHRRLERPRPRLRPAQPLTRCGLRTSVCPFAAAASAAIIPATPSALARA